MVSPFLGLAVFEVGLCSALFPSLDCQGLSVDVLSMPVPFLGLRVFGFSLRFSCSLSPLSLSFPWITGFGRWSRVLLPHPLRFPFFSPYVQVAFFFPWIWGFEGQFPFLHVLCPLCTVSCSFSLDLRFQGLDCVSARSFPWIAEFRAWFVFCPFPLPVRVPIFL